MDGRMLADWKLGEDGGEVATVALDPIPIP